MTPLEKRSATAITITSALIRVGDTLSDPKTILTWLLSTLGAPGLVISMLVPIRESGSMLPQIFISGFITRFTRRKPIYIIGLLGQCFSCAAIAISALFLTPIAAGYTILSALAVFATCRAFTSVTSKDILARAIPKGSRGKLSGLASMISGILATILVITILAQRDQSSTTLLSYLILGASSLWLLASIAYYFVTETVPADKISTQPHSFLSDLKQRLSLLKSDLLFRNFIIARTLLLGSALASPLLLVIAQQNPHITASLISFILAGAIASAITSYIWGRLSDHASHLCLSLGGLIAAVTGIAATAIYFLIPSLANHTLTWPTLFFIFHIGYAGVRLGRTTWVIDAAEGDKRTHYVSASNTIIAILILLLGIIAAPLISLSPIYAIIFYSTCCLIGAAFAMKIKLS